RKGPGSRHFSTKALQNSRTSAYHAPVRPEYLSYGTCRAVVFLVHADGLGDEAVALLGRDELGVGQRRALDQLQDRVPEQERVPAVVPAKCRLVKIGRQMLDR